MFRSLRVLAAATVLAAVPLLALPGIAAADGTLTVTPGTAAAGDTVTVTGNGCVQPNPERVVPLEVEVIIDGGSPDVTKPDDNGDWSLEFTAPSGAGEHAVNATCNQYIDSFAYPAATLTVTGETTPPTSRPSTATSGKPVLAAASLSADRVEQGGSLTVTGSGFGPGEKVDVILHSNPVQLAVFTADEQGGVRGTVVIPADATVGAHSIELTGETTGRTASAAVYVIAASVEITDSTTSEAVPVDGSTTGEPDIVVEPTVVILANTGSPVANLAAIGGGLAAAGAVVLLIGRRRGSVGRHR